MVGFDIIMLFLGVLFEELLCFSSGVVLIGLCCLCVVLLEHWGFEKLGISTVNCLVKFGILDCASGGAGNFVLCSRRGGPLCCGRAWTRPFQILLRVVYVVLFAGLYGGSDLCFEVSSLIMWFFFLFFMYYCEVSNV